MVRASVRQNPPKPTGSMRSDRVFLFSVTAYLLFASGGLRILFGYWDTAYRLYVLFLLAVYFLLLSTERMIVARWKPYQILYYPLIMVVVLALGAIQPTYDYYAILFLAPCLHVIWFAPKRQVIPWILAFTLAVILSQIYLFGLAEGISYSLTYIASGFFVSVLGITTIRAEQARAESQALLVELQEANRRLKEYADQVEVLAAVQERNRLARELHDSVTQTIFSITLTAQSALILIDRDPGRVKGQLQHLQSLSKNALAEMRALIQQLHPHTVQQEGLVASLKRHAAERKEKDGLAVEVQVNCDQAVPPRLPLAVEEGVLRVVQEALNNIVKHAGTDCAQVTLAFHPDSASITITDHGQGFSPGQTVGVPGHLGLTSMEERVRAMGGQLAIESQPGTGTQVRIEGLPLQEQKHA